MNNAKAITNSRLYANNTSLNTKLPLNHCGEPTWTLAAPKVARNTCCKTRLTPQVASSDSSGRL